MRDILENYSNFVNSLSDDRIKKCKTFDDLLRMVNFNLNKYDSLAKIPTLMWLAKELGIKGEWKIFTGINSFIFRLSSEGSNPVSLTYDLRSTLLRYGKNDAYDYFYSWTADIGQNLLSYITPFKEFLRGKRFGTL